MIWNKKKDYKLTYLARFSSILANSFCIGSGAAIFKQPSGVWKQWNLLIKYGFFNDRLYAKKRDYLLSFTIKQLINTFREFNYKYLMKTGKDKQKDHNDT